MLQLSAIILLNFVEIVCLWLTSVIDKKKIFNLKELKIIQHVSINDNHLAPSTLSFIL